MESSVFHPSGGVGGQMMSTSDELIPFVEVNYKGTTLVTFFFCDNTMQMATSIILVPTELNMEEISDMARDILMMEEI
jgi:hypothetical protein